MNLCPTIETEGRRLRVIGIYCKTREEWMTTWIASWYLSGCVAPLYDTLGDDSIEWIVKQTELQTIVTTTPFIGKLAKLKKAGKLELLKTIITIEEPTKDELELIAQTNVKLLRFSECLEIGKKSSIILKPEVTADNLATICYTSGTTSMPKGVMLTHGNFCAITEGIRGLSFFNPKHGNSCISWLPLAHVLEQFVCSLTLSLGMKTGFYSGDVTKLVDDLGMLNPHLFGSVPRVFNRIYEAINKTTKELTGFKKYLYNKGVAAKLSLIHI